MSVVYKARHKIIGREVALKILLQDTDPTAVERFKQEAKAASLLNHPNIIGIYDFGIYKDQAFLVMDCLEGPNLSDVLAQEGHIAVQRAINIFRQTVTALEHAHKKGVLHRDLKPSNLCLIKTEDGKEMVKIVDFGIAKFMPIAGQEAQQLTRTGEIFGSPLYMSPEQCLAHKLDGRSDIYSLGCVMYESLTGQPPIYGETAYETMTMHVSTPPKPFNKIAPSLTIDPNIEAIVFRCLEKKPDDRYQTMQELLEELPTLQPESGSIKVKAVAHPTKQKRELRSLRYGFWGLFVLVAVIFIYMSSDNGPNNDRGTVLDKTIWNASTTLAQTFINWQWYSAAQQVLDWAEAEAREHFSNRGRTMTALVMKRDLFTHACRFEDLEKTNKKIADVQLHQLLDAYEILMKEIDTLADNSSEAKRSIHKVMAPITFGAINHVARGLAGEWLDKHEEALLLKGKKVYTDLLGERDTLVADMDVLLAECYARQQKLSAMRPLLAEAVDINDKSANPKSDRALYALLKLGQVDRDENRFDMAKPELEKALRLAKDKPHPDTYLVYQCLNSLGSHLEQTGKKEEAKKLFAEADKLLPDDGPVESP